MIEHTEDDTLKRVLEFLAVPRTAKAICSHFKITRPTAMFWIGYLATEPGCRLVKDLKKEGKRGPAARTFQIVRSS